MDNSVFYAHIAENGEKQLVSEHLHKTAALAVQFAADFGASEQAELAALAHDLGKYSREFQKRLLQNGDKVDHSTAGAVECMKQNQIFAAMAVAGHHSGLLDGGSQGNPDGTFLGRIQKAMRGEIPDCNGWKREVTLPPLKPIAASDGAEMMFFTRMLYSCLTDADFLDTETFMDGKSRVPNPSDYNLLWSRLQQYIAPWFPPKGELNRQRCAVLQNCMEQGQNLNTGLFTLTVPTGGGKTVASLAFALAQAKAQGLRRVVYVVPYTSIIEQTVQVFQRILGEDQVLEHHSGVSYDIGQEATSEQIRLAKATENWDMPVVVTTAVQFFESLYAARSSKCRKLHNLSKSVIIFDEAQMLPLNYLRPCVFAMAQLVKGYGASVVLCTATQPALEPIFQEYLPGVRAKELCPLEPQQWERFRRVTFQKIGQTRWEQVAEHMNVHSQILCIVNSRRNAQVLYELLEPEGRYHLSTLMCPNHRRSILNEIRDRLQESLPCRVVSTSLIEAGVDVDFPAVFREEAGLDSILQAAGRCNREGRRPADESIMTIFKSETPPPPMFRTAIGAGRNILMHYEDIASPKAIHAYFQNLLVLKGREAQDTKGILAMMQDKSFPFRTVAENFKLIENDTKTIYIPLNDQAQELLTQLRNGQTGKALFRKLGQYGVNIYQQHYQALYDAGEMEVLDSGAAVLLNLGLYSMDMGLSLQADSGKALFI